MRAPRRGQSVRVPRRRPGGAMLTLLRLPLFTRSRGLHSARGAALRAVAIAHADRGAFFFFFRLGWLRQRLYFAAGVRRCRPP